MALHRHRRTLPAVTLRLIPIAAALVLSLPRAAHAQDGSGGSSGPSVAQQISDLTREIQELTEQKTQALNDMVRDPRRCKQCSQTRSEYNRLNREAETGESYEQHIATRGWYMVTQADLDAKAREYDDKIEALRDRIDALKNREAEEQRRQQEAAQQALAAQQQQQIAAFQEQQRQRLADFLEQQRRQQEWIDQTTSMLQNGTEMGNSLSNLMGGDRTRIDNIGTNLPDPDLDLGDAPVGQDATTVAFQDALAATGAKPEDYADLLDAPATGATVDTGTPGAADPGTGDGSKLTRFSDADAQLESVFALAEDPSNAGRGLPWGKYEYTDPATGQSKTRYLYAGDSVQGSFSEGHSNGESAAVVNSDAPGTWGTGAPGARSRPDPPAPTLTRFSPQESEFEDSLARIDPGNAAKEGLPWGKYEYTDPATGERKQRYLYSDDAVTLPDNTQMVGPGQTVPDRDSRGRDTSWRDPLQATDVPVAQAPAQQPMDATEGQPSRWPLSQYSVGFKFSGEGTQSSTVSSKLSDPLRPSVGASVTLPVYGVGMAKFGASIDPLTLDSKGYFCGGLQTPTEVLGLKSEVGVCVNTEGQVYAMSVIKGGPLQAKREIPLLDLKTSSTQGTEALRYDDYGHPFPKPSALGAVRDYWSNQVPSLNPFNYLRWGAGAGKAYVGAAASDALYPLTHTDQYFSNQWDGKPQPSEMERFQQENYSWQRLQEEGRKWQGLGRDAAARLDELSKFFEF
jgi:type II secretory pathway pseudopilin PulG